MYLVQFETCLGSSLFHCYRDVNGRVLFKLSFVQRVKTITGRTKSLILALLEFIDSVRQVCVCIWEK